MIKCLSVFMRITWGGGGGKKRGKRGRVPLLEARKKKQTFLPFNQFDQEIAGVHYEWGGGRGGKGGESL